VLALNPIHLSDKNHDNLIDIASLKEGLEYKEEIPDSASESSANDKDMEEEGNKDSENNDSEEEE
jgi:hypothetical protein